MEQQKEDKHCSLQEKMKKVKRQNDRLRQKSVGHVKSKVFQSKFASHSTLSSSESISSDLSSLSACSQELKNMECESLPKTVSCDSVLDVHAGEDFSQHKLIPEDQQNKKYHQRKNCIKKNGSDMRSDRSLKTHNSYGKMPQYLLKRKEKWAEMERICKQGNQEKS